MAINLSPIPNSENPLLAGGQGISLGTAQPIMPTSITPTAITPPKQPNKDLAIVTSTPAREATTQAQTALATREQQIADIQNKIAQTQEQLRQAQIKDVQGQIAGKEAEIKKAQEAEAKKIKEEEPKPEEDTRTPSDIAVDNARQAQEDANNKAIADIKTATEEFKAFLNAQQQATIDQINSSFDRQIRDTELLNKAVLGGLTQVGLASGRARYAPDVEIGNLAAEQERGIKRIGDLENQRQSLIQQAKNANTEKQFGLLFKTMAEVQSLEKEKNQAILDWAKETREREESVKTALKDALAMQKTRLDLDVATAKSVAGVTLASLTGDEATDAQLIQDLAGQYGVDPNMLLNEVLALEQEQKIKATGDMATLEAINAQRAARGETPLGYFEFLRMKKTAETLPETGGATTTPAVAAAELINVIGEVSSLAKTKFGQESITNTANNFIKSGDIEGAKAFLLNSAIRSSGTEQQNKLIERRIILDSINNLRELVQTLEDKGIDTGFLSGNLEKTKSAIGQLTDPDLTKLKVSSQNALDILSRSRTGAAMTESEEAFYKRMFPSTTKTKELNIATLDALEDEMGRENDIRLQAILSPTTIDALTSEKTSGDDYSDLRSQLKQGEFLAKDEDGNIVAATEEELRTGKYIKL